MTLYIGANSPMCACLKYILMATNGPDVPNFLFSGDVIIRNSLHG